jgi:hypothetical protein
MFSNGRQIGTLKDKTFSQTSICNIEGKEYIFKTKGFFKQNTEIIDSSINRTIGEITYSNWMTKATITIGDRILDWKYDNIWNTKWSVFDNKGTEIKYSGSSTKGVIESNSGDKLMMISGLFVTNYYWQLTIAFIVVILIPIWTNLND